MYETDEDLHVAWFYNWSAKSGEVAPPGVEFVPMIWFGRDAVPATLDRAKREGNGTLLGFNEPDHTDQANMTTDQAIDRWPKLESSDVPLISPAAASAFGGWLGDFYTKANARGYRVDFTAVHWYGNPNASSLIDHLKRRAS